MSATDTNRKLNKTKILKRALPIIIGAFITAYGLEAVLIPNNVSDGGVTGLSIVGSQLFGLPQRPPAQVRLGN